MSERNHALVSNQLHYGSRDQLSDFERQSNRQL